MRSRRAASWTGSSGFMVSPLLWSKVARGLSAGRVQSVAVRLIVEREREIRAFVPEEYWEIHADLATAKGEEIRFQVRKHNGQEFRPSEEGIARAATADLEKLPYLVSKREDKPTRSKAPAPFITSTLQQAASTRLGFSVKKTMMMAQRLYEAGYITYMRTDSTNLSTDAVAACRAYIGDNFPPRYLPDATPAVFVQGGRPGGARGHTSIGCERAAERPQWYGERCRAPV